MQSTAAPAAAESPPLSSVPQSRLHPMRLRRWLNSSFDFASQPAQTSRPIHLVCGALMADEVLDALLGGLVTSRGP